VRTDMTLAMFALAHTPKYIRWQMIKDTWLFACSCLRCEQPKHKQVAGP
jgi:hypothetical protein